MIQVLIVDDERSVRNGLLKYINWEGLGIGGACAVETVDEALDYIQREKPQIIISDIRMPGMNGIELCNAIRKVHPSCRIIFLSGYSDKEYLMGAIQLSVEAYLEKPVSIQEMEECLRKTVESCIRDSEKMRQEAEFAQYIEDNQDRIQAECIHELTRGRFEHAPLAKLKEENAFVLSQDRYYQCIVFRTAREDSDKTGQMQEIFREIRESLGNSRMQMLSEKRDSGQMVFLLSVTGDVLLRMPELNADCMRESIYRKMQGVIRMFGVIGKREKGYEQIVPLYVQACADLQMAFYLGYDRLVTEDDRKTAHTQEEQERYDLKYFQEMVIRKEWESAAVEAEKLFAYYREKTMLLPNLVKDVFFRCCMLVSVEGGETDNDPQTEEDALRGRKFLWEKINNFETLEECYQYLRQQIGLCAERGERLASNGKVVMSVMDYVRQHFPDPNLSVKEIADAVYLTPQYLSFVFKNRTGKNLVQYIKVMRLEYSVTLMEERGLTLADIAQRCGYADQNYFAKVFKKEYGMSPSEYRERMYK